MSRLSLIKGGIILIVLGIVTYVVTIFILPLYFLPLGYSSFYSLIGVLSFGGLVGSALFWGGLFITLAGVVKRLFPERPSVSSNVSEQNQLSEVERAVIKFIEEHGRKIRLTECASELDIPVNKVKEIVKSLEEKGVLKMKEESNFV